MVLGGVGVGSLGSAGEARLARLFVLGGGVAGFGRLNVMFVLFVSRQRWQFRNFYNAIDLKNGTVNAIGVRVPSTVPLNM